MNLNVSMIKKNVRVNILIVMMVVDQKMLIVNILKFKKVAKKYLDANPVLIKQPQLIAFTILAQRFISISKFEFPFLSIFSQIILISVLMALLCHTISCPVACRIVSIWILINAIGIWIQKKLIAAVSLDMRLQKVQTALSLVKAAFRRMNCPW